MSDKIRTVRFMARQSGEDLYRCLENHKVYVRQTCDDDYTRWLSSSKWTGGYEADCPIREGFTFRVVDDAGNTVFEETLIHVDGICDTCAIKNGPFSWEESKRLEEATIEKHGLRDYDEWSNWIKKEAVKYRYTGYIENWRYYEVDREPEKKEATIVDRLGRRLREVSQRETHRICGKTWVRYEIIDKDEKVVALCGYQFED